MEIITKLIEYFKSINSFYENNLKIYNQLKSIIKKKSKSFGSEIFYPSSFEILDELLLQDSNLFKELTGISDSDIENLKLIDDSDLRISSIMEHTQSESLFDEFKEQVIEYNIKKTLLDNLPIESLELNESLVVNNTGNTGDPCLDESIDEQYLNDILEQYKEGLFKKIDEDLNELLDKCRITKDSEFDNYKNIEDNFTEEEIQKILDSCFDDSIDDTLPPPVSDDIPSVDLSDDEPQTPTDDTPTNLGYETLKELMSDSQRNCFEELLNYMDLIQEKNQKYNEHVANKTTIQKEYAYYRLMNTMYDVFYNTLNNLTNNDINKLKIGALLNESNNNSNLILDGTLKAYSNEYSFIKSVDTNNITLYDFKIIQPKKPKGVYFNTFKKFESEFKKEKYKNGTVTKEELIEVESKMDKEFMYRLTMFDSGLRGIANDEVKQHVRYLSKKHLTTSKIKKVIKENLVYLNDIYTQINNTFKEKENVYINFNRIKDELLGDVNQTISEMEKLQLTCNEGKDLKVFDNVIPNDTHNDFRGVPDPNNPTMYDREYWVKFAELATLVGLVPIPQFTGSNDIKVDISNYKNPSVKIPSGGIAIDDGIPRFLFYPIGIVIPFPTSPDGLLKIPVPAIYINIFNFVVANPLDKIKNELSKYVNQLSEWTTLSKFITTDKTFEQALNLVPNSSVYNLLLLLGIPVVLLYDVPLNTLKSKLDFIESKIKQEVGTALKDISLSDLNIESPEFNAQIQKLGKNLDNRVANIRQSIQKELDNINDSLEELLKPIKELKLDEYSNKLNMYLSNIEILIKTFESITNGISKCVGSDYELDLEKYSKPVVDKLKKYSKIASEINNLIGLPKLQLPYIKLSDYLNLYVRNLIAQIKSIIQKYGRMAVNNLIDYLDLDELFPKLKSLKDEIYNFVKGLIDKIIKYKISEAKIDVRQLINFKLPKWILNNIGIVSIDFPELIIVGFIAQSGIVPYPVVMCINPTKKGIPGLIEPLSIKLILTADFKSPMKMIKTNWGSRILPLNTMIDTVMNADLGMALKPFVPGLNIPNLTNILRPLYNGLYNPINIINNFGEALSNLNLSGLNFDWSKFDVKNIFNVFNIPNPNLICKMIEAEDYKDAFDKLLNGISLNTSVLPPRLSQLQILNDFNLPDFNPDAELIIDDMKSIFDVDNFPSLKDIINTNEVDNNLLITSILGMSSLASLDLLPQFTVQSPYIQDDLPPWERLNLKNIPFVLFLIEFLIASKKGCKLPIPELPHLDMR